MKPTSSNQPWERQRDPQRGEEPTRAYEAFGFYRDLGSARSLDKVQAVLAAAAHRRGQPDRKETASGGGGRRVSKHIEVWSKSWRWVERSRQWDDEQDRLKRASFSREIEEMGRRHAQQAMGASQVLSLPFMAAARRLKTLNNDIGELERLPLADLLKMAVSSSMFIATMHRAEREARGLDGSSSGGGMRRGVSTDAPAAEPVRIAGAEFSWVQGRCTCSHTHSLHDQSNIEPSVVPCKVEGCKCLKYRDSDDAEAMGDGGDDQL